MSPISPTWPSARLLLSPRLSIRDSAAAGGAGAGATDVVEQLSLLSSSSLLDASVLSIYLVILIP